MLKTERAGRMPVVFVPHGGGPWPFVETGLGARSELDTLADYLRSLRNLPRVAPRTLLVVSAHWEEPVPTVMTSAHPPMLYDYYGFPPEAYRITWAAPGSPAVAARVRVLLESAGFKTSEDPDRGFDHGTFVPMKLAYPEANVPTLQLSLRSGLDPQEHIAIGRALTPLRDEGVFIVGSGMTYHNLRAFTPQAAGAAEAFDRWLRSTVTLNEKERTEGLAQWSKAPAARIAQPREEHLLPLMVAAGAAGADIGQIPYNGTIAGLRLSACQFG
jgi:aromatic ring-opening dioxygenase catalytic subunit (LigB family)